MAESKWSFNASNLTAGSWRQSLRGIWGHRAEDALTIILWKRYQAHLTHLFGLQKFNQKPEVNLDLPYNLPSSGHPWIACWYHRSVWPRKVAAWPTRHFGTAWQMPTVQFHGNGPWPGETKPPRRWIQAHAIWTVITWMADGRGKPAQTLVNGCQFLYLYHSV